ncbi:MAG TPA: 50S ribosomal protein L17 [Candidatus Woesebacteria bacterium]|nr:50S ribosomal protein L17 [Candidatus Woesebacteria bacterium]
MKHRVKAKHFNRDTKSRKALLKNLLRDLFEHGEIKTSESRTKEVRRLADKLIIVASQNTLAARRQLHKFFGRRDVVNALVDKIAPNFGEKKSGFTSLEKLAARRGDNTVLFKLTLLTGDKKWTSLKKEKPPEAKVDAKAKVKTETQIKGKSVSSVIAKKALAQKIEAKKSTTKQAATKKSSSKKPSSKKPSTSQTKKAEEKK